MACKHCNYKGYIEARAMKNANEFASLNQCVHCKDAKLYTQEVQKRMGIPVAKVVQKEATVLRFPFGGRRE